MDNRIAIILTSIERPQALKKSVESILAVWQENWILFVGIQDGYGSKSCALIEHLIIENPNKAIRIYDLGYNCGIAKARNELINRASLWHCDYVLLTADSITFDESMKHVNALTEYLNDYDLIGMNLNNRIPWEANIKLLEKQSFELDFIDPKTKELETIVDCDIIRNFWIARTDTLIKVPYDNDLIMCLSKNTPIIIKNGWNQIQCLPIKNLFPNSVKSNIFSGFRKQEVWTVNGWKKIINVSRKISKENIYRIHTSKGYIELTENHRLIINKKEIKAKKLKIGDILEQESFPKLSNKLSVNKDFAWMLGFFLAEGTCLGKGDRIEFTNQNIKLLKKCEKILSSIGIECSWYSNLNRQDKCHFLRVKTPRLLINYFNEFYKNKEKIIPYYVYDFNKKSRKSFIEGVFSGDGTKNESAYRINQKNASIINGLMYIAQDIYKSSSVYRQNNTFGEWFTLNLKQSESKNNIIKKIDILPPILDFVYDIECEGHIFNAGIANINVHNCEHEDFFWRAKQQGLVVGCTNLCTGTYNKSENTPEYDKIRATNFRIGQQRLKDKYFLKNWVTYKNIERIHQ